MTLYGALVDESAKGASEYTPNVTQEKPGHGRFLLPVAVVLVTLLFGMAAVSNIHAKNASILSIDLASKELGEVEAKNVQSPHPNIILFFIDDQGFADMGYNSDDLAKFSPNMDAAAEDGIKFDYYYSQDVCTPARAALMTGKYPSRVGMQYSVPDVPEPWGLPAKYEIMPEIAKFLGNYKTELVGKWHLGFYDDDHIPTNRGFDNFFGFFYGKTTYYEHKVTSNSIDFSDFHYNEEVYPESFGTHSTYLFQDRIEEIISTHDTADPLLLYYSHQLIHEPLEDPPDEMFTKDELDLVGEIVDPDRRTVGKMLLALDKMFDHLVKTLKANDMYDNSYIIVASDNGGCTYYQGQNYPLRGEKNTLFEGGVRVNAFIHSALIPNVNRGHTYDGLFHVTDWMPTIFQGMLGLQTDDIPVFHDMDGVNQWSAILGRAEAPRNEILHNIQVNNEHMLLGYRMGDYKLIYGYAQGTDWYTVESPVEKNYCEKSFVFNTHTFVFDMPRDPTESNDISSVLDDEILDDLWRKVDHYWDISEQSASCDADTSCYKVFTDNSYFLVPWVPLETDLTFRGVNKYTPYVH